MSKVTTNNNTALTINNADAAMATVVDNINEKFGPKAAVEAPVDPLAAMLAAATQQTEVVAEENKTKPASSRSKVTLIKVAASSSKDENGNAVQRRNRNHATRTVGVFTSEKLKMCWMGTHVGFATKTAEGSIKIMQNAPQKALAPLQVADDVVFTAEHTEVELGDTLELKKAEAFDKYQALGYTMLSRRGKAPAAVAPVVEQPKAEETVDTSVSDEDQAALAEEFGELAS